MKRRLSWLVEFNGKALAATAVPGAVTRGGEASIPQRRRQSRRATHRALRLRRVWNGVSVSIAPRARASRAPPGVKAIYPVDQVRDAGTRGIRSELATAIKMTGADIAQSKLGLTAPACKRRGDGHRRRLRPSGSRRLLRHATAACVTGYDFVGDDYNADDTSPTLQPDPAPGHDPTTATATARTSPASSAPAGDGVAGVAPGVTFGAYRVFGCEGSTTADIMLAAMERALADTWTCST